MSERANYLDTIDPSECSRDEVAALIGVARATQVYVRAWLADAENESPDMVVEMVRSLADFRRASRP